MENKYWTIGVIILIILSCAWGFLNYKFALKEGHKSGYNEGYKIGYDKKICASICPVINPTIYTRACPRPNADKICEGRNHPMCVGKWKIIDEKCQWVCWYS